MRCFVVLVVGFKKAFSYFITWADLLNITESSPWVFISSTKVTDSIWSWKKFPVLNDLITSIFSCIFSLCSGIGDRPALCRCCLTHHASRSAMQPLPCWAEKAPGGRGFPEPLVQGQRCACLRHTALLPRELRGAHKRGTRRLGLNGQQHKRLEVQPELLRRQGQPSIHHSPGGRSPSRAATAHAETQEQPLTARWAPARDSPFAPGLFGRQVTKSDTLSVGRVPAQLAVCDRDASLFPVTDISPRSWQAGVSRFWTEEGRKDSPTDKKRYWKSRFSLYSQLSLAVRFLYGK